MAVYVRCPNCKNEYNIKHQKCPKCGTPKPRKGNFRIRIVHKGKTIRKLITGITQALAKEIDAKIKQEIIEGMYFEKKQTDMTLNEFFETKYLPVVQGEKKSWYKDLQHYRDHISPFVGEKKPNEISPLDVEKIKKHLADEGKAPRTIEYVLATLRHIINKAKDWGYFEGENPTSKVKKPKADNRRIRFLTKEESSALLAELKRRSQQTYEIAYLSLYTGMRASEIFNLKWSDIDFNNDIIHIKDPKSGENRTAYMTKSIKQLLNERYNRLKPNSDELVFKAKNGGKITRISKAFERAVKKLGLNDGITDPRDKVVFHTLRHTFASWLVMKGTPLYTVKELLGHKTLAMTERYSHLAPDSKRKAVEEVFEKGRQ